MELDDLKNSWEEVNDQVTKQKILNAKLIDKMIHTKYNSSLKKVIFPEIIGIIVCISAAIYIALSFIKLDTTLLRITGIVSILLLFSLSVISLVSMRQLYITGDLNKTYAATLKAFAFQKTRFLKLQRINVLLGYLLMVTIIVLLSKFFSGRDISDSKYFWIFSITFGYIFLLFYSKWVLKHYKNTLRQTEILLEELRSQ